MQFLTNLAVETLKVLVPYCLDVIRKHDVIFLQGVLWTCQHRSWSWVQQNSGPCVKRPWGLSLRASRWRRRSTVRRDEMSELSLKCRLFKSADVTWCYSTWNQRVNWKIVGNDYIKQRLSSRVSIESYSYSGGWLWDGLDWLVIGSRWHRISEVGKNYLGSVGKLV